MCKALAPLILLSQQLLCEISYVENDWPKDSHGTSVVDFDERKDFPTPGPSPSPTCHIS